MRTYRSAFWYCHRWKYFIVTFIICANCLIALVYFYFCSNVRRVFPPLLSSVYPKALGSVVSAGYFSCCYLICLGSFYSLDRNALVGAVFHFCFGFCGILKSTRLTLWFCGFPERSLLYLERQQRHKLTIFVVFFTQIWTIWLMIKHSLYDETVSCRPHSIELSAL